MIIGIDGSRAFIKKRTGIEEYSYQVIKHLRDKMKGQQVILCVRHDQDVDFGLPENWKVKKLWAPRFWTQIRLSLEMFFCPVDVLFVPAHTVPLIHPDRTAVTIHGLEYEFCPAAYSFWEKFYMRKSIKNSCRWASEVIAVSWNTKKDLVKLYNIPEGKIKVVYEGYNADAKSQIPNPKSQINSNIQISNSEIYTKYKIQDTKYLLFIGRLEERKNIVGIIKAFEILKEHYRIPHKLILAGKFGHGREKIEAELQNTNCSKDIIMPGYVSEEKKWDLLEKADIFLFPTFYEGFGIPVLEAQSMGVPVVAGDNSSIPEIVGANPKTEFLENLKLGFRKADSALLVNPNNAEEIADAAHKLISDKSLKNAIIKKGYENVKRFSWENCSAEIVKIILKT